MTSASIALSHSASHASIRNSALNNSTSKMRYSFTKNSRFSQQRLSTDALFYNIPEVKDMRSTKFGLGNKLTFEDKRVIPSANAYQSETIFQNNKNNKKGYTFGVSREKLDAYILKKPSLPGPGDYNTLRTSPNLCSKIMGRVRDTSLDEKIKVPGPGMYELPTLTGLQRIFQSKRANARLPVILKDKRDKVSKFQTPGPSEYNPETPRKKSLSSKRVGKFSMTKRGDIHNINKNPGPGFYNHFSEFS